jgi:hypothetical protein
VVQLEELYLKPELFFFEKKVVDSAAKYIIELLEKPESILQIQLAADTVTVTNLADTKTSRFDIVQPVFLEV